MIGNQTITLLPGEFVSGRHKANEDLNWKSKKFDRCMLFLEKNGFLTRKVTNKFTVNSIINWQSYQSQTDESDQLYDQQLTNKRPTVDQQMTTYKNDKNVKNEKNKDIARSDKPKRATPMADDGFWEEVRSIYTWVNVDMEIQKMKGYMLTPRGKNWKMTQRRVIEWLNRIDKPAGMQKELNPIEQAKQERGIL